MEPTILIAMILPWVCAVFLGVLLYQLVMRHGAALLREEGMERRLFAAEQSVRVLADQAADHRIAALEERVRELSEKLDAASARALAPIPVVPTPPPPPAQSGMAGVQVGSAAPDFNLQDVDGHARSLKDFLGEPRIVVFFDPQCGFCQRMSPRLADLPADAPKFLMVTRREPAETKAMMDRDGWHFDAVVDNDWKVTSLYGTSGTPTGYLIDADGKIASSLAVGADALLNLIPAAKTLGAGANSRENGNGHAADLTPDLLRAKTDAANDRARAAGLGVRDSQLNRDGLKSGAKAPNFTLPDLKGKKHQLSDFRGRKVLLVFSDPDCGPCMNLVPKLVEVNGRLGPNDPQIVVVSRGELAKNLAKEHEFGINYPVLLQKHWEISKEYAMFATPVGYLIDEKGTILNDVAIGADAILTLIEPIAA